MKKIVLAIITLSLIVTACRHSDRVPNKLLSKDKLISQLFTINANKDTVLTTANGAFITIPQGALQSDSKTTVQLEIKEAYSMEQIILASLITQSNGRPLSSGGMIYINAVGGQTIKISKAIGIRIPTAYIDRKMQLFKGEEDRNGNINWVKPDSLPKNPQLDSLNYGQTLFINNCAACHAIGKDGTGPDLAHILARTTDRNLLYAYTRNNFNVMNDGNRYYRCLYEKRNKAAMNLFPSLTNQDLDNLYGYIENESYTRNLPASKDEVTPCLDSCRNYWETKSRLENQKETISRKKTKMVTEKITAPVPSPDTVGPPLKVAPLNSQSLYYAFTIEALGWYNIDILLSDTNAKESSLMVRLKGIFTTNINVYLVIPSAKVFEPGGLLNDEKTFGFYKTDGSIYLPQNILAYIIAMGESGDSILFSKTTFNTSLRQEFDLELSVVTKGFFNASMKELATAGIDFSVNDTQNAGTLRKINVNLKEIEKIRPVNCDCNCGLWGEGDYRQYPPSNVKDTSSAR